MGTSKFFARGYLCNGLASHRGWGWGVEIQLVANSCLWNWDKLRPDKSLGSYAGLHVIYITHALSVNRWLTLCHQAWVVIRENLDEQMVLFQITRWCCITSHFNNMRTLKFKAQPTNAFFATVNQMFDGSSQLSTAAEHAVIKSLCRVQTTNRVQQYS